MESIVVPLWPGRPPHAVGDEAVDRPFLEVFRPAPGMATGSAMLIFPGGCYTFLSERSGAQYGRWLAAAGVTGAVVNFRLGAHGYRYPALLADARQAFTVLRAHAVDWQLDTGRVGVIGTSAGGHLAALLLTGAASDGTAESSYPDARPTLGVLCYPVISLCDPLGHEETRRNFLGADHHHQPDLQERFSAELRVTGATPHCFIWHTNTDEEVSSENSRLFAEALRANGVPYELHLYGSGAHALGLATGEGLNWSADCIRWLHAHGF